MQASKNLTFKRYPLSPMQKGMLFRQLDAPASGAYIQQVVVDLREPCSYRQKSQYFWKVARRLAVAEPSKEGKKHDLFDMQME